MTAKWTGQHKTWQVRATELRVMHLNFPKHRVAARPRLALALESRRRTLVLGVVFRLLRLLAVSGCVRPHETGRERIAQVARNLKATLGQAAMVAGIVHEGLGHFWLLFSTW
jgi:propanediol dehydratase small subunit